MLPSLSFLSFSLLLIFATAQSNCIFQMKQSDCNGYCSISNNVGVEICLQNSENPNRFFYCCCAENCVWIDPFGDPQGQSFQWRLSNYNYGEYTCVNSSNNNSVLQTRLVLPQNMTQHCQSCLSIAACTTHTPRVLRLSGSFQFNKQLIDGNCMVKDESGSIGCVPHLPVNVSINESVNLSSIYIHCPICESSYTLNYYLIILLVASLPNKSQGPITNCWSPPQPNISSTSTLNYSSSSVFANYTEAPSSDIVISKTTDIVMSTVSQTQTTNASSSLPTLPVASVIPGTPTNGPDNTGAIIGGVVGGIIVLVLLGSIIILLCWYCCFRNGNRTASETSATSETGIEEGVTTASREEAVVSESQLY